MANGEHPSAWALDTITTIFKLIISLQGLLYNVAHFPCLLDMAALLNISIDLIQQKLQFGQYVQSM